MEHLCKQSLDDSTIVARMLESFFFQIWENECKVTDYHFDLLEMNKKSKFHYSLLSRVL